jgi:hypothetical protein
VPIRTRADDRERDQTMGIGKRQRADQNRADEREDGGIRADSDRKEHGDADRKPRLTSEGTEVLAKLGERHAPSVAVAGLQWNFIIFIEIMNRDHAPGHP